MTPKQLQTFLYDQIPLARALGVSVVKADAISAVLKTPLEPNRNHLGTAFGGSLGAVLILSGYTWLYNALATRGHLCHVILQRHETDYLVPVDQTFETTARGPDEKEFERFLRTLERKGRARITLEAIVGSFDRPACEFTGDFVAEVTEQPGLR